MIAPVAPNATAPAKAELVELVAGPFGHVMGSRTWGDGTRTIRTSYAVRSALMPRRKLCVKSSGASKKESLTEQRRRASCL